MWFPGHNTFKCEGSTKVNDLALQRLVEARSSLITIYKPVLFTWNEPKKKVCTVKTY